MCHEFSDILDVAYRKSENPIDQVHLLLLERLRKLCKLPFSCLIWQHYLLSVIEIGINTIIE